MVHPKEITASALTQVAIPHVAEHGTWGHEGDLDTVDASVRGEEEAVALRHGIDHAQVKEGALGSGAYSDWNCVALVPVLIEVASSRGRSGIPSTPAALTAP